MTGLVDQSLDHTYNDPKKKPDGKAKEQGLVPIKQLDFRFFWWDQACPPDRDVNEEIEAQERASVPRSRRAQAGSAKVVSGGGGMPGVKACVQGFGFMHGCVSVGACVLGRPGAGDDCNL